MEWRKVKKCHFMMVLQKILNVIPEALSFYNRVSYIGVICKLTGTP